MYNVKNLRSAICYKHKKNPMQMKIILMIKRLASTSISCPNEYENLMEMVEHMYFQLALRKNCKKKLQLIEIAWQKHSYGSKKYDV